MERETIELIIGSFALLSFCYMGLALSLLASRRRKQKLFDKSKLKYTDGDNT